MPSSEWIELAHFQLHVAERWRERGQKTQDSFAAFFFYFAGFNALYFLWSKADGTPADAVSNEAKQIGNLLSKADGADAAKVLQTASRCVDYFARREPIERMNKRPETGASTGDATEGRKERSKLRNGGDADRLAALGRILYLVRSNLVHGSKMDQGDDAEVIQYGQAGLSAILDWSIDHTWSTLGS